MPPQNRLPVASGNFDYPPASSDPDGAVLEVASRLQNVHDRRRGYLPGAPQNPNLTDARSSAEASRTTTNPASLSSPQRRMRSVLRRIRDQGDDTPRNTEAVPTDIHRRGAQRPQAQPSPAFQRLREQRESPLNMAQSAGQAGADNVLQEGIQRLAQVNEDMRHLLEMPLDRNSPQTSRLAPPPYVPRDRQEDTGSRRKRRKIDTTPEKMYTGLKYGYYGSVVPGKLKMSLSDNDGGAYGRPSTYQANNMLKDDLSVYSSKKPRANMIFTHEGETTFSITKLVIKAPKHGFTDPVQQGLVFVSTHRDLAFENTVAYQMFLYSDSSFAKMKGPDGIPCNLRARMPHNRTTWLQEDWSSGSSSSSTSSFDDEEEDYHDNVNDRHQAVTISSADSSDPNDSEAGDVEARPARTQATETDVLGDFDFDSFLAMSPPEIEHAAQRGTVTQDDRRSRRSRLRNANRNLDQSNTQLAELQRLQEAAGARTASTAHTEPTRVAQTDPRPIWATRRHSQPPQDEQNAPTPVRSPSPLATFEPAPEREQEPSNPNSRSHNGQPNHSQQSQPQNQTPELLTPDARFSMLGRNSKMVIRFDPPLSGKYILLKLWTPRQSGNIDVQNVSVYGFAGPRYFPAFELR